MVKKGLAMESRTLPSLREAFLPLWLIAFMLGHEDSMARACGRWSLITTAIEYARFVDYMDHIQTCFPCRLKHQLVGFKTQIIFVQERNI